MKTPHSSSIAASVIAALALFVPGSSRADDLAHADKSFLTNAYEDGLAEVRLGEMAQRKTGNADVKSFAERISTDHNKANAEMRTLAASKKVTVTNDVHGGCGQGQVARWQGRRGFRQGVCVSGGE